MKVYIPPDALGELIAPYITRRLSEELREAPGLRIWVETSDRGLTVEVVAKGEDFEDGS